MKNVYRLEADEELRIEELSDYFFSNGATYFSYYFAFY